jgi:hypothetical protein
MAVRRGAVPRRWAAGGFYQRCRLAGRRLGVVASIVGTVEMVIVTQGLGRDEDIALRGTWVRRRQSSRLEMGRTTWSLISRQLFTNIPIRRRY